MLDLFNVAASGVLAFVSGWAVMSTRVRCGLLMHAGLVCMALGFMGVFLISIGPYAYAAAVSAANAFVHGGLVLCALGYLQTTRKRGHRRRVSDWVERRRT